MSNDDLRAGKRMFGWWWRRFDARTRASLKGDLGRGGQCEVGWGGVDRVDVCYVWLLEAMMDGVR